MSECEAGPTMMKNDLPHWDPRIMVAMVANCPLTVCDQLVSQNRKNSQDGCWGVWCMLQAQARAFSGPLASVHLGNFRACSTTTISTIIWSPFVLPRVVVFIVMGVEHEAQ
jgi:hypothetical protein